MTMTSFPFDKRRLTLGTLAPKHKHQSSRMLTLLAVLCGLLLCGTISANAAPFEARGNEPFWHLRMTDGDMSFSQLGAEQFSITPTPKPITDKNGQLYTVTVRDQTFSLSITDKVCADTMSGMPHPKTVRIAWGTQHFSGCGGAPATLLHGDWKIIKINGAAPFAQSSASITFSSDNRVSGHSSCNRFVGSYFLTGESLSISSLSMTRMLCKPPLMAQENAITNALESVDRFDIDAKGRLILISADTQKFLARKQ